jgi:threonine dehydratase
VNGPATVVVCAGCGYEAPPDEAYPFRCKGERPGDGIDHLMVRELDPDHVSFPRDREGNPFVRYRELFHATHLGSAHGLADADHVALVDGLDARIAEVDGHGFRVTPFEPNEALSRRLGFEVWVKDETANVSGSHKARHAMGLMLHLLVVERIGLAPAGPLPELAIASCGNAALGAAVVARAAGRDLRVFVPTWADPVVIARLEALGARIQVCPREEGVLGDPAHIALRRALEAGAIPFTCQGPDNGLTIEAGETIGYEMVSTLWEADTTLDRLVVQVGGGALASSCVRAFEDAALLEVPVSLPRIHAVQAVGGHPLERAYRRVRQRVGREMTPAGAIEAMSYARAHRDEFMWPWEEEPRGVATGILDDETYDWAAVVGGMLATGGSPVVVSDEVLEEANRLARDATGIDVDHTGSSGLAGLLELSRSGEIGSEERVAVLFTGVRRQ